MCFEKMSNLTALMYHHCQSFLKILSDNLKILLYGSFFVSIVLWALINRNRRRSTPALWRQSSPDPEKSALGKPSTLKPPERRAGVWTPVDFRRPKPAPLLDWDVHETEPLPYRPFRYGPYHITMGLRTMQWDDWIELDNHYLRFHADKTRRIEERGDKCCRTAPEAMDGAIELLEEL